MENKELRLLLTQNCNFDCVHCNHEGFNQKVKSKLTLDDYIYLYTVCKDNFNWYSISLTGGEPLLYRQFDNLVNGIAKRQGQITVVSNGEFLDKHMNSIDLCDRLNVSFHSAEAEKFEQITKRKGAFSRVASNINAVRINSPHVDLRLNVVLQRGFNGENADVKRILDFADFNGCSVKFIELANDKDKIVPLEEIRDMLLNLGLKERIGGKRKIMMSDNVLLTRTFCEDAQLTDDPQATCNDNMDFFVTPSGTINNCVVTNDESTILKEIKSRNDEKLVDGLKQIGQSFGKNCAKANRSIVW